MRSRNKFEYYISNNVHDYNIYQSSDMLGGAPINKFV